MTLWLLANGGPAGFDAATFTGPALNVMAFAAYLVPLAILELYLHAQKAPAAAQRLGMAAALFVLTLVMGVGIAGAAVGTWIPNMDMRSNKLTDVIAQTVRTQGVDAAVAQYRSLRAEGFPGLYEKESQTNSLGYQFLHGGQPDVAVAVLQMNVDAHPNSANAYDSLGEAYAGAGNKALAIENYRKALALDPKMNSSINALKKLTTP